MQDIPPIIYNIRKKSCLFQVQITPYNTQRGYEEYTVSKVQVLKQLPKNPPGEKNEQTDDTTECFCIKQILTVKLPEGSEVNFFTFNFLTFY